jgi:predicted permease
MEMIPSSHPVQWLPLPIFATLSPMPVSLQIFAAIFLVGGLLRSFAVLTKVHAERLATLVFSVCLPATILVSLDQITFNPAMWTLPVAAGLITIPLLCSSWLLTRLLQLPRPTQGGFLVATGLVNSVYFSYPVVLATFGEEGLVYAVLFDLGQSLLTFTVVYALAVRFGAGVLTNRSSMMRFFSAPPLWALGSILTLKLAGFSLPSWLHHLLMPIHLTTTPLASLVLGLSVSFTALRRHVLLALLGVVVRMGGGFLLGLMAANLLNLTGLERAIVILVAAMPSAVNAVIFATEAHLDEDLVTSIVALSICLGVAVLPWLPQLAARLLN